MQKQVMLNMDDKRPTVKKPLPFRIRKDFRGLARLEYEALTLDGQRIPYQFPIGDLQNQKSCNPTGFAIYQLMQQYYELEKQVDILIKERDDAIIKVLMLEGEVAERDNQIKYQESRKQKKKDNQI